MISCFGFVQSLPMLKSTPHFVAHRCRWRGLLGSVLTDLGIVNSLGGATLGSLIELIFPGRVTCRGPRDDPP